MRQFIEFNSYDDEKASLEVNCYALQPGEMNELLPLLDEKGFKFQNIQADSIRAKIEGTYEEIWELAKKLMIVRNFCWGELKGGKINGRV